MVETDLVKPEIAIFLGGTGEFPIVSGVLVKVEGVLPDDLASLRSNPPGFEFVVVQCPERRWAPGQLDFTCILADGSGVLRTVVIPLELGMELPDFRFGTLHIDAQGDLAFICHGLGRHLPSPLVIVIAIA
ncbi:hypothetical protein D3C76_481210 [compost metagenome]